MLLNMHMASFFEDFQTWDEGGWWRGLVSLVDDCHPVFKDLLINDDIPERKFFAPVDEVWYDTSDGEVMKTHLSDNSSRTG